MFKSTSSCSGYQHVCSICLVASQEIEDNVELSQLVFKKLEEPRVPYIADVTKKSQILHSGWILKSSYVGLACGVSRWRSDMNWNFTEHMLE
jgi:hypothetical protein